jgi:hypothetical protein
MIHQEAAAKFHGARVNLAAFLPRWLLPLSTTQKTRRADA